MHHQEFALSTPSDAEVVQVSVCACWRNHRWSGDGYECGWFFHSEWIPCVPLQTFGACSQSLITMSYDHHAFLPNRHWSFRFFFLTCCGWGDFHVLIWCCLSIRAFQEALKRVLAGWPQDLVSHLWPVSPKTPSRWPPQRCSGWLARWWNNSFPAIWGGGWVRLTVALFHLFFSLFCTEWYVIKSDLCFANTQAQFSGQEKGQSRLFKL